MQNNFYTLKSKVSVFVGNGAWHFLTINKTNSEEIKMLFGEQARGWGSLPVRVKVGATKWKTSIFPDRKAGIYMLPVKAEVRKKEEIKVNDTVEFTIEILV